MPDSDSSREPSPVRYHSASPQASDNEMASPVPTSPLAASSNTTEAHSSSIIRQPIGFTSAGADAGDTSINVQPPSTTSEPQTAGSEAPASSTPDFSAITPQVRNPLQATLQNLIVAAPNAANIEAAELASPTSAPSESTATTVTDTAVAQPAGSSARTQPALAPTTRKGKEKQKSKTAAGGRKGGSRKGRPSRKGPGRPSTAEPSSLEQLLTASGHTMTFRLDGYLDPSHNASISSFRPGQYPLPVLTHDQPSSTSPGQAAPAVSQISGGDLQPNRSHYQHDHDQQATIAPICLNNGRPRVNAASSRHSMEVDAERTGAAAPIHTQPVAQNMNTSSRAMPFHQQGSHIPRELISFTNQSLPSEDAEIVVPPVLVPSIPATLVHTAPNMRVLRILTLLIEDLRGDQSMDMLVELRIPLRQVADDPEDGYWADAWEVSEELQNSPSRIEGRAKVYAMRGKYRQYFLRLSPEEGMHTSSANLKVSIDRTLQIYIEDNPPLSIVGDMAQQPAVPPPTIIRSPVRSAASDTALDIEGSASMGAAETQYSSSYRGDQSSRHAGHSALRGTQGRQGDNNHTTHASAKRRRSPSDHVPQYSPTLSQQWTSTSTQSFPASPVGTVNTSSQASVPPETPSPSPGQVLATSPPLPRHAIITQASVNSTSGSVQNPFNLSSARPSVSSLLTQLADAAAASTGVPSPHKKTKRAATNEEPAYPSERRSFAVSTNNQRQARVASTIEPRSSSPGPFGPWFSPSQETNSESSGDVSPVHSVTNPTLVSSSGPFGRWSGTFAGLTGQIQDRNAIPSLSLSRAPSSALPSASAPAVHSLLPPEVDNEVINYLRGIFSRGSQWDEYLKRKNRVLKVSELLEQYKYVQSKVDAYLGKRTPSNLVRAANVEINKDHIVRVLGLRLNWIDDCKETLTLNKLYGPGGERYENVRAVEMFHAESSIATSIQAEQYLKLLREIHSRWTIEHPTSM